MIRGFRTIFGDVKQSALRQWDRIPMRTQGRITVGLPLVAVFISASLALIGNNQRVDIETDVQRKFEMSGALGDLTTLMVNAETGMRGYLLTGRPEFLQPFDQASAERPTALARLNELAMAEPGAKPRQDKLGRIEQLRTLTDRQLTDLALQQSYVVAGKRTVGDAELLEHLTFGKGLMDQIRVQTDAMRDEEQELLDDRLADINSIRERDYISVTLALIVALGMRFLAWYLFRTGTVRRVERLTENVRNLRQSNPQPFPPRGKKDPLGELEREIELIDK